MTAPNEMPVKSLLGTPEAPLIVDASHDDDVAADPVLIPGATRHPRDLIDRLARRLDGARAVIACQKGRKLSQGIASWLRSEGIETGLPPWDAFYRWARDGRDERHDWPAGRTA